mmetsp:Transcript_60942/g.176336  ORF Transcript_60942/g.176336 Transcript_60942/m.176336 type:complete len:845 (+) Transcript_60942:116-2650(+)
MSHRAIGAARALCRRVVARNDSAELTWRHLGARRYLLKGHTGKTLEKLDLPRHQWLKEVDQAPQLSDIRRQKDKYFRELGAVHKDMVELYSETEAKAVLPARKNEKNEQGSRASNEAVNEALRMYRLLRPNAEPFYEEDAMRTMQAKANKIADQEAHDLFGADAIQEKSLADPFKAHLPVVNQRAFLLAVEAVAASLADDIETMCTLVRIPKEEFPAHNHPLRFKLLLDKLFGAFPLKKDPSQVGNFMQAHWDNLKCILPNEIARLPHEAVETWLRGHLIRVRLNQRRRLDELKINLHSETEKFGYEEFYSFAEDFPYDDDPMSGLLADERNLDFPLDRAGEFMSTALNVFSSNQFLQQRMAEMRGGAVGDSEAGSDVGNLAEQFQNLVWDLEKVGLRNWLRVDTLELENKLPKGDPCRLRPISHITSDDTTIPISDEDEEVAKLMLQCASRDRTDLLEFEKVDPYKMLYGLPAREVEEELAALPQHNDLPDEMLQHLVDKHVGRLRGPNDNKDAQKIEEHMDEWKREGASIEDIFRRELDFYRTAGPVEWTQDSENAGRYKWKWRQPPNTFWDDRRKVYIQVQKGVDPSLNLKEMRQHMLDMTRMSGMVKVGRINYFRAIVVVGNGKGVYGFGVGFGNTSKEARADAALKALQNLDYIDLDVGRMLCTPTKGQEYKHEATIIPRPLGRGLRANKKFLPMLYILGLDNCKVKFRHGKWFTRIRALKRALDMIISRRTLANMTGKRYALLVAPGDHWVHWPDRWFEETSKEYVEKQRQARLARRHALHFKRRDNLTPTTSDVYGGWRKENWIRWSNPLERWLQDKRRRRKDPTPSTSKELRPTND